jgi:hypothetical protein
MRPQGVAQVTRELRKIDRGSLNALRKDMRKSIMGIAKEIAGEVPPQAPISGMQDHNGVTRWGGIPRASVSFTPGGSRGGGNRLLSMKFTGGKGRLGFDYAELAGSSKRPGSTRSKFYSRNGSIPFRHNVTSQGDKFNSAIADRVGLAKGKSGFFVFDSALKKHGRIEGLGKRAIDDYMRDASRELQRVRAV